jgi:hypothetical protein
LRRYIEAQEEGLLSLTSDAPRMFFNFEDYLKHAQVDRVNQVGRCRSTRSNPR